MKRKSKIIYIKTSSYEWGRIREDLVRKMLKRDDLCHFYRAIADTIRAHTSKEHSFRIPFDEKAAKWLRDKYDIHEMNQPPGGTKAVSEAAKRLRRNLAEGVIDV